MRELPGVTARDYRGLLYHLFLLSLGFLHPLPPLRPPTPVRICHQSFRSEERQQQASRGTNLFLIALLSAGAATTAATLAQAAES